MSLTSEAGKDRLDVGKAAVAATRRRDSGVFMRGDEVKLENGNNFRTTRSGNLTGGGGQGREGVI